VSDALEELKSKLEASQRALAEAEARCALQDAEHQADTRKLENTSRQVEHAHQEWISALDVVADPIFLHDKNFHILRCNLAYQHCAGIPFEQIIGQPYYDVFPKTHAPLASCLRALEKSSIEEEEEEVTVGDTTYRSRAYSVTNGRGSYLYSVHTLEDIKGLLRINQLQREAEMQYRQVFEAATAGILILDAETGKIIDANPFILDLLSCSLSDCAGKMLWEIGMFRDVESGKEAFKELQAKGYTHYEDLPLDTKDGRRIDVELISNRYKVGNRKVIQCNVRDISERLRVKQQLQEAKMQYRLLFEAAGVGVLILDGETGKIVDANPFILDMLSCKLDECAGKVLSEIGLINNIESGKVAFNELQSRGYIRYEDLPLDTKDGRRIDVELACNRYEVGNRKVIQCNIRDITQRKADEARLKLFRALLDNSSEAIEVVDPVTLRFIDVNETECTNLGYSREELLSMSIYDIDPTLSPEFKEEVQERFRQSGIVLFESVHRRKNGSTFPVEVSLNLIKLDKPYALNIVRDITERRRAENSLRKLSLAVEQSPNSIVITDLDANIEYANQAFTKVTGYSLAEAIGQNPRLLQSGKTPKTSYDDMWAHLTRGEVWRGEFINRRKDGSEYLESVLISPVRQADGRVTNYLAIKEDITQRRQMENALRKLSLAVEQSTSSIVITDLDANIEYVNEGFVKSSGYSREEVIGRNPRLLHSGKNSRAIYDDMWAHITQGLDWKGELINLRKDGSEYIESVLLSPVRQADGSVTNYLAIQEDITERRQMENALRVSREHLQRLLNSMAEGAYGVDTNGNCTFVNQAFLQMLGYWHENEVLGMHTHELIHHSHSDGSPYPDSECNVCRAYRSNQLTNVSDEVFWRKDGVAIPVEYWSHPVVADGVVTGAIVTFVDITERKNAEVELRQKAETLRIRVDEVTRFNRVAVGRELRMTELKQEVNELCRRLGEPPRHMTHLPLDNDLSGDNGESAPPGESKP
jgi:PAS domain S-box-containing protein